MVTCETSPTSAGYANVLEILGLEVLTTIVNIAFVVLYNLLYCFNDTIREILIQLFFIWIINVYYSYVMEN